ncbi:MAG: hypothetical protein IPJ99_00015 [Betaproteobacteria bacterium]|nr:hypothetical protein [Betaproteobacteria bacterium]
MPGWAWRRLSAIPALYRQLQPLDGAKALFRELVAASLPLAILTATPLPTACLATAADDKREWVRRHLCPRVPVITVSGGEAKALFAAPRRPAHRRQRTQPAGLAGPGRPGPAPSLPPRNPGASRGPGHPALRAWGSRPGMKPGTRASQPGPRSTRSNRSRARSCMGFPPPMRRSCSVHPSRKLEDFEWRPQSSR